jgi:hypothetical protein
MIANILRFTVTQFFEGAKVSAEKPVPADEQRLLAAYRGIRNKADRNLVVGVARSLASKD